MPKNALTNGPSGSGHGDLLNLGPRVLNGRYELREMIGQGGMGVVYRAFDRQHPERALAIKCIVAGSVREGSLGLFKAEFKAMSELRHPNVARVYDFERIHDTDDYLFTMELVDGVNAFSATRHLTPEAMLPCVVQVCHALSYMHSRGLIHRDLKPANIMVDADGNVKVLDFGLVGVGTDGDAPFAGTPAYLAPEMLAGARGLDHRADLYSLGITCYELLCGRLPFQADSITALLALHRTAPLQFDDEARARVPAWIRSIIERLCAKHPADRFRSGNAVIEAINAGGGLAFEVETSATRDSYLFAGRLVGRDEQLGALSAYMDERLGESSAPREPVFLVAGPSGSGKSRLMLEARYRLQLAHGVFIETDCYEGSLAEYEPIVAVLTSLVQLAESFGAVDLLDRFAPTLALLAPSSGRSSTVSIASVDNPDAARVAMIDQIGDFMVAMASRTPYVIYVNDLQWARAGALDTLLNLSRRIAVRERGGRRVRLAILGSIRDDEIDGQPVEPWLRTLRDNHEIRLTRLGPLGSDAVAELLRSMLAIPHLPTGFVERVTRETAGNPFYIGEILRSLVERGSIHLDRGRWSADSDIGVLDIPTSMTSLFMRRLAQLAPRQRDVFQLVTLHGRPIPLTLIAAVARLDEDGLHHIVQELVRRQLVLRGMVDGQPSCWPIHDRIRELAYEQTDRDTRLRLHRALAEALEARADADLQLEELARQWWAAEDREKAFDYCVRGGRQAKRRHALQTGIVLLGHALACLPDENTVQRTELEEEIAEMLALTGAFEQAEATYDRLLPKLASTVDRARVLRQLGSIRFHRGDTEAGRANIWQALGLLGEGRPRGRMMLLLQIGFAATHHFLLRFVPLARRPARDRALCAAKADAYLALVYPNFFYDPFMGALVTLRGANCAARLGPGPQLSLACCHLSFVIYGLVFGRFETALAYSRRTREIADDFDLPLHRALSYQSEMFVRFLMGDLEAVEAAAREASTRFRAHGDMYCVGASYCMLLLSYLGRGMLGTARQAAQEGLEIIERVGALAVSTPVSMKLGRLLVDLGSPEIGLPKVHEALAAADRMGDPVLRAWARLFLGYCYFTQGDLQRAIAYLTSCVEVRRRFHLDADFLSNGVEPLLARAYIDSARESADQLTRREMLGRARRHARAGLRSARRRGTYRAAALLAMAESRWEDGRVAEARLLFERAIACAEMQGARMMLADAHYELGRRERAEDAQRHLLVALEHYDACEAAPFVQRVQRVLASDRLAHVH